MEHGGLIEGVIIVLIATVLIVPLFRRARLSAVLGYLAAGVVIGPSGLALIPATDDTAVLAELGVVFLLFVLGLELSLQRLIDMRRDIFGLGLSQVLLTGAAVTGITLALGFPAPSALVLGGALALSSTAVVLQLLGEQGLMLARIGRLAFAVLLFQDLAVAPILALVPVLGGDAAEIWTALGLAALKAAGALIIILAVARYLLRPVLALAAASGTREVFVATALLLAIGTGWATHAAGLSMALGAFLAGTALAGTEYRHQIEADIVPFEGVLLGFFFVTVGMTVDLGVLAANWIEVIVWVVGLIALKASIIIGLALAFGHGLARAVRLGLLLSQVGEFSFVILSLAGDEGLAGTRTVAILIAAIAVTMALTPLLASVGRRLERRLEARAMPDSSSLDVRDVADHTIIAGFGRVGQMVANLLHAYDVPYVALDLNAERVAKGRREGHAVYYGDAAREDVLEKVGAGRASALVVTLDKPGEAGRVVATLRRRYPMLHVTVRAHDREHATALAEAGANIAVPETLEASLQLGGAVLEARGLPRNKIDQTLDQIRASGYAHDPADEPVG